MRIGAPGAGEEAEADTGEVTRRALQTGRDAVDLFVETVVGLVDARFADLTYDRTALVAWLHDMGTAGPGRLFAATRMIHGLVEQAPDREVRTRTLVEALLDLSEDLLRPFFADYLIPLAGRDVLALNLLSQMTEDEIRHVAARLVSQESLLALSSELLEFPWEEVQRRRLIEAITSAARGDDSPSLLGDEGVVLEADDPLVVELREEILASCQPDVLLERSAQILLALVLNADGEEPGASAADALEEILGEALARGRLELATQVLSTLDESVQTGGARSREQVRHLSALQQRLGGRTQVALLGGLLRQHGGNEQQLTLVARYLGLVAREAIREFTALLADERDRQVRARMCQVLAKVGPSIVPTLVEGLGDPRWFLVRNLVHVLGKIGDEAAFAPVVTLLGHSHLRVRIEAVRALALIAPARAASPILPLSRDVDPEVRLEAVRALGALRRDEAVPVLRDVAAGAAGMADVALRRGGRRRSGGDRERRLLRGAGEPGPAPRLALEADRAPAPRDRRGRAGGANERRGCCRMSDAPRPDPQLIFTYLHGMLRAAGLYLPTHPQTRRAKLTLFDALTAYLAGQGRLTYRFMGDLLVANDRILPRESLLYRRFLETCQTRARPRRHRVHTGSPGPRDRRPPRGPDRGGRLIDRRVDRQPSAHPPPPGAAEPA